MKTPDEIKKGLECCLRRCDYDKGCAYAGSMKCCDNLKIDALAYIQQLERERDALEALDNNKFQYETGFVKGFEAAQPKWISVEERLPDKPGDVLIRLFGKPCVAHYHKNRCFETRSGVVWWSKKEVTHWMPLPQPPKEGACTLNTSC